MKNLAAEAHPQRPDVLIVDDTTANLQLLTEMLRKCEYRVRPVPSGRLALQAILNQKPDLILLDIDMPEMNGYEVCAYLKAEETLKDIPVLFISALNDTTDKVKAFAVGGVDYITKPFRFEEVEARVQTHLKLRRFQLELETQNRQLQETYDQLKKLENLQENLTHMIIHDMRSPLQGIMGYMEVLEDEAGQKLSVDELGMLIAARSSGRILLGMVNSLLDVSRLEHGKMPLSVTNTDLDALIQNALDSLGSLTKRVSISYQKLPTPAMVNCDANLIMRVIANLVGNAIKFTPAGNKVSVSIERIENAVKLRVADTGRGIPREYHEKIFEKFGQIETQKQRDVSSTGLGLTFCKLAVEAHGGEIGVESELDKGSTFWFTLPA